MKQHRRRLLIGATLIATSTLPVALLGGVVQGAEDDERPSLPGGYGLEGDQELETLPPPNAAKRAAPEGPPTTHAVKGGDTLWGISRTYFRDPHRWPKIWAANPEIANPHWIYPGQALRLVEGAPIVTDIVVAPAGPTAERESGLVASAAPRRGAPGSAGNPGGAGNAGGVGGAGTARASESPELRQIGFVDEGDLKAAGFINGSVEEKILLGSGDHAYVEFPADKQPKGGTRLTVYQVDQEHPILEPLSKTVLGYLVHVYGDVVIDHTADSLVVNARLVDLVAPVERGYLVGPQIQRLRSVRPKHNQADMTARVVASVEPNILIANQMFVVLNRGSRHGVEAGNRFLVLRQGDGIKRVMEDWDINDHRFPPHAVSEIVAVHVQNETTIGWISRGTRELHIGDLADLRSGY